VVLVEDAARLIQVQIVRGALVPRQSDDPVEVAAGDGVLGAGGVDPFQPGQFSFGLFEHFFGQFFRLDLLPQFLGLRGLRIGLAELFLDGLELLAQVVLALALVDLAAGLGLDALSDLHELLLPGQQPGDELEALLDVEGFERRLLVRGVQRQAEGDQVAERPGIVDIRHGHFRRVVDVRHHLDDRQELLAQVSEKGAGLDVLDLFVGLVSDLRPQ